MEATCTTHVRHLEARDLHVVFQPIIDLADDSVFAHEALVRCSIPEYAHPTTLFDRAEAGNCTARLGRMIREKAMPLSAGERIFVNVHPSEVLESLLARADDPIFSHDAEVVLELTEALPIDDIKGCAAVLRQIREHAHIRLAIDDFGCGYSNLRVIADLEPEVVKLDRGLVHGMSKSHRQQLLARWLVQLCDQLGAVVVAEGIEEPDDLLAVRDAGIAYAQGFLLGRPAPRFSPSSVPVSMTLPTRAR